MAAHSHRPSASRSIIERPREDAVDLPDGACGYRDLSNGRSPTCGCKRFWLNDNQFGGQLYCYCSHHACYHTTDPQRATERDGSVVAQGVNIVAADAAVLDQVLPPSKPAGLGIRSESVEKSQFTNTRVWQALNQFARDQEDGVASDDTSRIPSTAVPSVIGDGIGLSSLHVLQERASQVRLMGPPVSIPAHYTQEGEEYSATEVATPSIAGTPNMKAFIPPHSQARAPPVTAGLAQPAPLQVQSSIVRATTEPAADAHTQASYHSWTIRGQPMMSSRDVQSLLESCGRRIDVLENLSFNHIPPDELHERFETVDGRLLDLEQWRIEKIQDQTSPQLAQPPMNKRRRLLPTETSSFASSGSFDSAAAMHTEAAVLATLAASAETGPRLDDFETRIADLEKFAPPSYARPWQVQVILLPWGRELRGIWYSADGSTQQGLEGEQQWPHVRSGPKLSFKSSSNTAWTTESIQAWAHETQDWLSPKACGPSGSVFQRLQSRGLVQNIAITAPDARHILDRLDACFRQFRQASDERAAGEHSGFQALSEEFIPLRKARKSSRLRFLSPSEMVTSASWTASFLDSSVLMKINDGQRRLYLTTRNAYSQPSESLWSWPMLRQLPSFAANNEERVARANAVAIEVCWTFDERLDQSTNNMSSRPSEKSSHGHRSPQLNSHEEVEKHRMSPCLGAKPLRERTVSMPNTNPTIDSASAILTQRRVVSSETIATGPLQHSRESYDGRKRRRVSVSPEAERKGTGLTPRWSREPPSPSTSGNALGEAQSPETSRKRTGNTPFAYATPHSNSTYVISVDMPDGDGDTEADLDVANAQSLRGEIEWQGVEDAGPTQTPLDGHDSARHGLDVDEASLDDG